jgi:hypothetical protein
MKLKIFLIFSLFSVLFTNDLKATHIVGGEIYYLNLGNNVYEIRLVVYRDCWTGIPDFDDPAAVGIFDSQNNFVDSIMMKFKSKSFIPPHTNDPCIIPPANICYEVTTYIDTISLPPIKGGYQISYQRCCRNNTILNIIRPDTTGATYYASIPDSGKASNNSSPRFKNLPPSFACVNQLITLDHSAIDDDGDSLVYSVCDPLHGARSTGEYDCVPQPCGVRPQPPFNPPYSSVLWRSPYGLANVFGGNTPLSVDPKTGQFSAIPNTVGQFVYGVCVKEYRKGVFLDEVKRDYQLNVLVCQKSTEAIADTVVSCGNNTIQFINKSKGTNSFFWDFGDGKTNSDTSTQASPVYTYSDTGTYQVKLIAKSTNQICNDTLYTMARILPAFTSSFTYTIDYCTNKTSFVSSSSVSGTGIPNTWKWSFNDPSGTSSLQNPFHTFPGNSSYQVTLITATSLGCKDTTTQSIFFPYKPMNINFTTNNAKNCTGICDGNISSLVQYGNPPYSYQWDTSASSGQTPQISNLCPGKYSLAVTDTKNCTVNDSAYLSGETLIDFEVYVSGISSLDSSRVPTDFASYYLDMPAQINSNPSNIYNSAEAGKYIRFKVKLKNMRSDFKSINTASCLIRTNNPEVILIDSVVSLNNLAWNTEVWSNDEFEIYTKPSLTPGSDIYFDVLALESGNLRTTGCVSFPLSPLLPELPYPIEDGSLNDSHGNNNHICEAGETISFFPELYSISTQNANNVFGKLVDINNAGLKIWNNQAGANSLINDHVWWNYLGGPKPVKPGQVSVQPRKYFVFDYNASVPQDSFTVSMQMQAKFISLSGKTVSSIGWSLPYGFDSGNNTGLLPEKNAHQIKIFPNPFHHEFSVLFDKAGAAGFSCEIKIYDICGKLIRQLPLNYPLTNIQRENLKNGIYLYEIQSAEQLIERGKLIIY